MESTLWRAPDGQWVAEDHGALMAWPDERGGWANRTAWTGDKRQLKKVADHRLARGTGWPGAGRGRALRSKNGVATKTIGIRATDKEHAKWVRATEASEKENLTEWARDELNAAADRTLGDADTKPRSKK